MDILMLPCAYVIHETQIALDVALHHRWIDACFHNRRMVELLDLLAEAGLIPDEPKEAR